MWAVVDDDNEDDNTNDCDVDFLASPLCKSIQTKSISVGEEISYFVPSIFA